MSVVPWTSETLMYTATLETGDETEWCALPTGLGLSAIQASGDFGGGSLELLVSNDQTNALPLKVYGGDAVPALTAPGGEEINSGFVYFKARLTGGAAGSVDLSLSGRT